MTTQWDEFIESLDGGDRQWVNSVNRDALAQLTGDERERALTLLIGRLPIGSPRISRALGVLPDPRVQKALEQHLLAAQGADRVATASALLELGGSSLALAAIEQGLADPDLVVANEALKAAPLAGKPIRHALLATAVSHPRDNIRVGAIKAALFISGVNPSPLSWDHKDEILALTQGATPALRRTALATLCKRMAIDPASYRGPQP